MRQINGPAPGFRRHPEHRIAVRPSGSRWTACLNGELLADSDKTLVVEESGYGDVVYFPYDDVRINSLEPTMSKSTCPFKGEADYFSIAKSEADIAWRYKSTYDEVTDIAGYVAFYADRIQISEQSKQRK